MRFQAKKGIFGQDGWTDISFYKWLKLSLTGHINRVILFEKRPDEPEMCYCQTCKGLRPGLRRPNDGTRTRFQ